MKKARVVLVLVIAVGLAALGWFTTSNACIPCHQHPFANHASWMEDRLSTFGRRKLSELVLPASHDAAMYRGGFLGWGQTQCLSIGEQLENGVRWFDLRPKWTGEKFVIHHGSINGPDLSEVLGDVAQFAKANHRELILLKFSHFDGIDPGRYPELVSVITNALGPWLFKQPVRSDCLANVSLEDYVRSGPTILALISDRQAYAHPVPGIWTYADWDSQDAGRADLRVFDKYSDTEDFERMASDQWRKFRDFNGKCKDGKTDCDLFLLSWTLTPSFRIWAGSQPALAGLADALKQAPARNSHGRNINLIYADFVEFANVTEMAIAENERLKK